MFVKPIAVIRTEFPEKFGIPRQSGLARTTGQIVFKKEYADPDAFKGLEDYSHIWLIWGFSENRGAEGRYRPMVRPPRLGGNQRMGVFATRSPYRPNPLGLSCVKLLRIENRKGTGVTLWVEGADLLDKTPIYDVKPYLPYVDAKPGAAGGFADRVKDDCLQVEIKEQWLARIPEEKQETLIQILSQDPRPSYQEDDARVYGMTYAGMEIRFQVSGRILRICEIQDFPEKQR